MSDQKEIRPQGSAEKAHAPAAADADRTATRRRMIKAGIAAAPLLLTLRGRPARATTQHHQQSLGSLGVFYGAYVTQEMIDNGWFEDADLGKTVVPKDSAFGEESNAEKAGESLWELDKRGQDRRGEF